MSFLVTEKDQGPDKAYTEFGYALLRLMGEAGFARPSHLARAAGVSPSTMGRLLHDPSKPRPETLAQLAEALVALDKDDPRRPTAVEAVYDQLFAAAGYRMGAESGLRQLDPRALELDALIGEGTPLSEKEVAFLRVMYDQLAQPYRAKLARAQRRHSA